jgi:N-acetyl-alpha-D-muramate 1-phosphate uridylyltransferase
MIFAAGFGTRMGILTQSMPKPLIPVAGKPLIDHALAIADGAGVTKIVINLHYLGAQIETYLAGRSVDFSWEKDQILDTGGGLKAALALLDRDSVFALNSDAVWTGENPLLQLCAAWDPDKMDVLLLLLPQADAMGHAGTGDFILAKDGRISRAKGVRAPIYLGAQILKTSTISAVSETVFSLGKVWDDCIAAGRAYGIIHQGGWCDVGHPAGIALAESMPDV